MATIYNVGFIGGGKGGESLLLLLGRHPNVKPQYVCDINPDAPAMKLAKSWGIDTITDIQLAFKKKCDFILEATGVKKVEELVAAGVAGTPTKVIHHDVAQFFSEILRDDEDDVEDTLTDRYLTFALANEDYGVEISLVMEIITIQNVNHVPNLPPYMKGIINLRGTVIPIMDMRLRFNLPPKDYDDRTSILIVKAGDAKVGMIVDASREVLRIPTADISEPPQAQRGHDQGFIRGIARVDDAVKILLDIPALLKGDEWVEKAVETAEKSK